MARMTVTGLPPPPTERIGDRGPLGRRARSSRWRRDVATPRGPDVASRDLAWSGRMLNASTTWEKPRNNAKKPTQNKIR